MAPAQPMPPIQRDRQREAIVEQRAAVLREVEAFREAIRAKLQHAAALAKQAGMVTNDSQ